MANTVTNLEITADNGASGVVTFGTLRAAVLDGNELARKFADAGVESWRIVARTARGVLVREWSCVA